MPNRNTWTIGREGLPFSLIVVTLVMVILFAACSRQELFPERPTDRQITTGQVEDDRAKLEKITKFASEYYRHPQPERIPEVMQALTILHRAAKDPSPTSSAVGGVAFMTGFLAEAFRETPDKREQWIKTNIEGEEAQQSILHALALAGLQRLAITAMEVNKPYSADLELSTGCSG
jgi:hypothetical protein